MLVLVNYLLIGAGGFVLSCFFFGFVCGLLGINIAMPKLPPKRITSPPVTQYTPKPKEYIKPIHVPNYLKVYIPDDNGV